MTPAEMRVAIAEVCGWKFYDGEPTCHHGSGLVPWGHGQRTGGKRWDAPAGVSSSREWQRTAAEAIQASSMPQYPADLNAMHEARAALNIVHRVQFCNNLRAIITRQSPVNDCDDYDFCNATAHQRAEAFCRTLWPERFL